jgi:hypothetical protein
LVFSPRFRGLSVIRDAFADVAADPCVVEASGKTRPRQQGSKRADAIPPGGNAAPRTCSGYTGLSFL